MKQCKQCQKQFEVMERDKAFYQKMEVPEPTRCPACREMRRLAFRNERSLYLDACSLCKKQMFSMHHPSKTYPVFCNSCWYSDKWDAHDYARDFDFNRPFFEQFKELLKKVPRMATSTFDNENSDFVNCATRDKNCYLIFGANFNEDVYYGNYVNRNKYSLDLLFTHDSELCYECTDCEKCYNTRYSRMSSNCMDCAFISDCKGCSNCFGCAGLRNKKYCLFNKQLTREAYEEAIKQFDLSSRSGVEAARAQVMKAWNTQPVKYYFGEKTENVTGNALFNAHDCVSCFESTEIENCAYAAWLNKAKDCYDIFAWGFTAEKCYECVEAGGDDNNVKFCRSCFTGCHSLEYSDYCLNSHDLFGCVSMRKVQYCIFNKQYSPEEYAALKEKIIAHMRATGEYGEFFPPALSQYGFNETKGIELYPVNKEQALALGFNWQDNPPGTMGKETLKPSDVLDALGGVSEDITKQVLACVDCGKNYKIIVQELKLYKKIGVPVPLLCPNCRHMKRMVEHGTHVLYKRQCGNCSKAFQTSYSPERPEQVWCERCYIQAGK